MKLADSLGILLLALGVAAIVACGDDGRELPQTAPATAVPSVAPTAASKPAATGVPPSPTPAPFPFTVIDDRGVEVIFDEAPERIVAYDGAAVEMLFDIGEGDRVIATHSYVSYPPEIADLPRVGDAFNMNVEEIVALEPDLVFVFFERFVEDLEKAGLTVLYLETLQDDFARTADRIRLWGRITGNLRDAEAGAERFETRLAEIVRTIEGVEGGVRVLQDVGGFWVTGSDTLVGEVFRLLKLDNVARGVSGYEQLSPEAIVASDPEVIIAASPEAYTDNEAFREIAAVRNGMLLTLPSDSLSLAGPRFVEGIEELAALVYPEAFGSGR